MVDVAELKADFSGEIILPNDEEYTQASTVFIKKGSPAVVLRPKTVEDVQGAVRFAKKNNLIISVRSGGHNGVGFGTNDGGAVIDMGHFDSIELVDASKGLVRLGTGALWGDVAKKLEAHNLAISSGDTTTVGVGGLTLGGGIGWMVRKYGLAIDNLREIQVVLADGSVVSASETENAELFWAIRGGGGNFGIVTEFDFAAHFTGEVYAGSMSFGLEDVNQLLRGWRDVMRSAPDELTTMFLLMPSFGGNPPTAMVTICYAGDEAAGKAATAPFESIGVPLHMDIRMKPYSDVLEEAHPPKGIEVVVRNAFIDDFSDEAVAAISELYKDGAGPIMQIRSLGGAYGRIPNDETAYAHRRAEVLVVSPSFLPPEVTDAAREAILQPWSNVAVYSSGSYVNLLSTATSDDIAAVYPPSVYDRLALIKAQYDPEDIFSQNYNVRPA